MEILPGFSMPLWIIITIVSAAAVLLILLILKLFLNSGFMRQCGRAINDPEVMKSFLQKHRGPVLLRNTRLIEKAAEKIGQELITAVGIDMLWEDQFINKKKISYLKKIIKYFPEKGIFFCITAGKNKPAVHKIIRKYTEQNQDPNLLKRIGSAAAGADFDGAYACSFFGERFQELMELTGDPEWFVRFFAVKQLIYSSEDRALRAVWGAFDDSAFQIRKAAAEEFSPGDTDRLSCILKSLLLDDPSYEVRKSARERLDRDFPELYRIETGQLSKPQLIHLLGHLHDSSDEDADTAIGFLLSEELEIRVQAALYLQRQQQLDRLFKEVSLSDMEDYNRTLKLLSHGAEVNCTAFLDQLENTSNPASVSLASELLKKFGKREYINKLAAKVFLPSFQAEDREHYLSIYRNAVECISIRGNETALKLLNHEMIKKSGDAEITGIILPLLPEGGEDIFIPTLLSMLKKGGFILPELLRATIERFQPSSYFEELISIIYSPPEAVPHSVKKEAFKILGELSMPCCMQIILENLSLLNPEEQREFAVLLTGFDRKVFEDRVDGLIKAGDSTVKAALFASLPPTGITRFVKDLQEAAIDPDPEVRVASIRGLAGFGETKLLSQMTAMLRDPVERVRRASAEIISAHGTPGAMAELKIIINDPNEVLPVKTAAISGLGSSEREESIPILIDILGDDELRQEAAAALSGKTDKKEIRQIIELFKDAPPQLREYIAGAFKAMGESAEPAIAELLSEDISSLRVLISEIMLKTGFIETTVKKLSHRKPEVRKKAAALLSQIQTKEAFKGIVLAARDPDTEVRVEVLRALEKLNTPEGEPLLKELREDPDKRVRKYTLWAMERIEAKNLSE